MSEDAFSAYDETLAAAPLDDPWTHKRGQVPAYAPDYDLLGRMLTIPTAAGNKSQTGRFARGIDAWLAYELRRAGFKADEVWPRPTQPRVLPRDIAVLLETLPKKITAELQPLIAKNRAVGPADARVLGRAYDKQVDVCIARWDRGPELLLSTKAQVSSFGKNLPNRFEEAYGDASNLRGRYPLAATGFFFVQHASILREEPDAYERTMDMTRKLRDTDGRGGYTATGLALVDWDKDAKEGAVVTVELDEVPDDIGPAQFLAAMIAQVVTVTPVTHHVDVRELREKRKIALPDAKGSTDDTAATSSDVANAGVDGDTLL